jgi:hypothetical protein
MRELIVDHGVRRHRQQYERNIERVNKKLLERNIVSSVDGFERWPYHGTMG